MSPSVSSVTEAEKDPMEGILFIGQSILLCLSFQVMEKPWNEWPTKTAFPVYHRSTALLVVPRCHLILVDSGAAGQKQRQMDFDVDDIVRSTWQLPEVKHWLNSGPWGKGVVAEAPHFHRCRTWTVASMLERVISLFVCKALGASVTSHYNKSNCVGCWWQIIAYVIVVPSTTPSPPKMPRLVGWLVGFFSFLLVCV